MPQIVITQEPGPDGRVQIRIDAQLPPEPALMLLAQAIEILRTRVIAKAVQDLPPSVTLASALPADGLPPGAHGIQGGDMTFRKGPRGG